MLNIEKYTNIETVPVKWHKFTRFVRIPVGFCLDFAALISLLNLTSINDLTVEMICLEIMVVFELVLMILYFVGSFSWKRYAWISIIIYQFYGLFLYFCLNAINTGDALKTIAGTLGRSVWTILEFIYFYKREYLFSNGQSLKMNIFDNVQSNNVANNLRSNNISDIIFCRKCGTKLDGDIMFCRKCGARIGN